ncbi:MAG: L-fucose:H+ symporter permease [Desulfovibrio sp.]|nr:L-fucose:H+ symporter permease [Desulfovibrio sp.]
MKSKITTPEFKGALALITVLFFMWGLSYGLVDVLNKHFQEVLNVTKAQSGYIQFAYFGAYFVAAIPAALFMNRFGYKAGIILGLCFFAGGAFLTIPAADQGSFPFFLFSFFILALGLGALETAANPYATVLGPEESSAMRLNLAQCFNGVGQFLGPMLGGVMFYAAANSADSGAAATGMADLSAVKETYVGIGVVVTLLALFIARTALPDIREKDSGGDKAETDSRPLVTHREFIWGVLANFFYIAAQVGLAALFINLTVEYLPGATSQRGAFLLSVALGCFLLGRFVGTAAMTKVAPERLVAAYGIICALLCVVVFMGIQYVSVVALITCFFFMSIMFPTIFALGLRHLGSRTKIGSSCMIMSIVGGALMPILMGAVADTYGNTATAYGLPVFCFLFVALYGQRYNRLCGQKSAAQ